MLLTKDFYNRKHMKVRSVRSSKAEIGDKFTSRHGQKGVIGLIVNPEDMPFTSDGIIPDIIINPHSIPSRMTIGQLLEQIFGKTGCFTGSFQDGTPFNKVDKEYFKKKLRESDSDEYGNEVLYNPETGERINSRIFIGIAYYLRLRHLAEEKLHTRTTGPTNLLTRQPTQGKANEGGQRIGSMEASCMVSQGCAGLLDGLRKISDEHTMYVCSKCGNEAIYHFKTKRKYCNLCKTGKYVKKSSVPWTYNLLTKELQCMGIFSKKILSV